MRSNYLRKNLHKTDISIKRTYFLHQWCPLYRDSTVIEFIFKWTIIILLRSLTQRLCNLSPKQTISILLTKLSICLILPWDSGVCFKIFEFYFELVLRPRLKIQPFYNYHYFSYTTLFYCFFSFILYEKYGIKLGIMFWNKVYKIRTHDNTAISIEM